MVQLNKYETDPDFLRIFQSQSVCLIICTFCKSCELICESEIVLKIKTRQWGCGNVHFLKLSKAKSTTSWGCWKYCLGIPGVRPMFLKPKLHKESKNGFKTINYRRSPVMFFSKNYFRCKKSTKQLDVLLIFEFYGNIYGWIRLVQKK